MYVLTCLLFLIQLNTYILGEPPINYNKDELKNKYPDYGVKWMFFPNGNGVPIRAYLDVSSHDVHFFLPTANKIKKTATFRLYTRKLKEGKKFSLNNLTGKLKEFDVKKPVKLITHGWMSSESSHSCKDIKDAYLLKADVNVIIFDWSDVAGNIFYPIAMASTREVGQHYAKFIDYLIKIGVNPRTVHLIGHSLGAHVSGFAGRYVTNGTIGRITGLDPALPGFSNLKSGGLSSDDADFVDVIHTCGGVLGVMDNIGDADFYPNQGKPPQPGCRGLTEVIEGCSHGMSWKYFVQSIFNEKYFASQKCKSWDDYLKGSCENDYINMGESASLSGRGSYYLKTKSLPPYND